MEPDLLTKIKRCYDAAKADGVFILSFAVPDADHRSWMDAKLLNAQSFLKYDGAMIRIIPSSQAFPSRKVPA